MKDNASLVALLIGLGADPEQKNHAGRSPVAEALRRNRADTVLFFTNLRAGKPAAFRTYFLPNMSFSTF
eukprot:m.133763 g.133763  ORF g.133763 m.133763 type:complete len:69 (+) comp52425_c0_seq4:367-573(+)